jgi:hypothetical protein
MHALDWRMQSYIHFHPNGSLWIHHRTPTKFAHGQPAPDRPSTHVTARTAGGSCNMIISHLGSSLDDVTARVCAGLPAARRDVDAFCIFVASTAGF